MRKNIKLNTTEIHEFSKENIRGVLLNLNFKDSAGLPTPITAPQNVKIKLTLQKEGKKALEIFDGNMSEAIAAFVSQTTQLRVVTSDYSFATINRLPIELFNVNLQGDDKFLVETTIRTDASTGSTVAQSDLSIESLAGQGDSGVLPVVKMQNFATGDTIKEFKNFDLGTFKVVLLTDLKTFNHASTKTADEVKIESKGYNRTLTSTIISYENDFMNEGENRSLHEVVYNSNKPLYSPVITAKLLSGADSNTRLISVSIVRV